MTLHKRDWYKNGVIGYREVEGGGCEGVETIGSKMSNKRTLVKTKSMLYNYSCPL